MNRTDRMVGILLELQAHDERRGQDLAQRFEVSLRTIYRDLEALCEAGVPLVATPGKGYRLLEGYFLPPLAFTPDEAALLVLGGEFVQQRLDEGPRQAAGVALRKLTAVLPEAQRLAVERWRSEIRLPGPGFAAADSQLRLLRRAIRQRRVVRLLYHTFQRAEADQRDVEPVRLALIGDSWQLSGFCRLRQAQRFFRLGRIERLELLPEEFERSERHALPASRSETAPTLPEVRVCFAPDVAHWVRERQPYAFLREEDDTRGSVFVYALRNERELLGWLLGWGDGFEVLSPASFRRRVAQTAARTLARHTSVAVVDETASRLDAADRMVSTARL